MKRYWILMVCVVMGISLPVLAQREEHANVGQSAARERTLQG